MKKNKTPFYQHHENIKLIEAAIKLMIDDVKQTIIDKYENDFTVNIYLKEVNKTKLKQKQDAYTKILLGLIISWTEELTKRLLYEPNAFKKEQITEILAIESSPDRWKVVFKVAFYNCFRKNYDVINPLYKGVDIDELAISKSLRIKYNAVAATIEDEIFPAIKLRNKVQHGEWVNAFDKDTLEYSQPLKNENIRTIQVKINIIKAIYKMMKELATYNPKDLYLLKQKFKLDNKSSPFEYFFDKNYEIIETNKKHLQVFHFGKYKDDLIARYKRGKEYKKS
jgi:hypothetical protein